jgi:hypothetical protein
LGFNNFEKKKCERINKDLEVSNFVHEKHAIDLLNGKGVRKRLLLTKLRILIETENGTTSFEKGFPFTLFA